MGQYSVKLQLRSYLIWKFFLKILEISHDFNLARTHNYNLRSGFFEKGLYDGRKKRESFFLFHPLYNSRQKNLLTLRQAEMFLQVYFIFTSPFQIFYGEISGQIIIGGRIIGFVINPV